MGMNRQKPNAAKREDVTRAVERMSAGLLPVVARKKAADVLPVNAGSSFFYEVVRGWETKILKQDEKIYKVRDTMQLEEAFIDTKVRTILIPFDASITKTVALRVCRRHGQGKTIFYEVEENE